MGSVKPYKTQEGGREEWGAPPYIGGWRTSWRKGHLGDLRRKEMCYVEIWGGVQNPEAGTCIEC